MSAKLTKNIFKYFGLPLLSVVFTIIIFEVGIRIFLEDSPSSYAYLWGRELPSKVVFPTPRVQEYNPDQWCDSLIVDDKRISRSDLWGIVRPDSFIGWVPSENTISTNGWWQSNNLGARSDKPIKRKMNFGVARLLIFGDSFAQGSRLPQEQSWPYILDKKNVNVEVINFGVDGYSTGQAFLRYIQVRKSIDYDMVLFLFVPSDDLWRDINVIRFLAAGWPSHCMTPRFIVEEGKLRLIEPPIKDVHKLYKMNHPLITDEVRDHLLQYDRFYRSLLYEDPPVLRLFIFFKLAALYLGERNNRQLFYNSFMDINSESWQVTRKIFYSAKKMAAEDKTDLFVAMLPTHEDVQKAKKSKNFRYHWQECSAKLRQNTLNTIDLLPVLISAKADSLDYGYDKSHYGHSASKLIAQEIYSRIYKKDTKKINENSL